ncbi:MAG: hydantoinase B/oxoprolinase family protein [Rhodospirillaceae bacterium]|nr:hydantoinase B/oxoprolinase family protein [Rhodospirillaceae bacterium]
MGWQFWIDRGGTFTDIVARDPNGGLQTAKLLSENPEHYSDSAVAGVRQILGLTEDEPIGSDIVDAIKMGTTVATNALLERKGAPTLLAITRGFGDALRIGTQQRPTLFDLNIRKPSMLYSDVLEVPERLFADGTVETPLDTAALRVGLQKGFAKGFRSVAIALLHAYRYPAHEKVVSQIAKEVGFTQVSASHDVIPLMKLVGRGDTAVADAYLSPELRRYVEQVASNVGNARVLFMQSNGGLTDAQKFRGKDAILSGPAGGAVGMVGVATTAGFDQIIGFDMGGTSTDVSHYAGSLERTFDTTVAGIRLRAPMMDIHTVAAGGGSRCLFDGLRLRVGPESAGSDPGPTAYRRGGPLTITDCNVLLGRIQPAHFPAVFGKNASQPLDSEAVRTAFEGLADQVTETLDVKHTPEALADGFLTLAVENMARAIKTISVQRGHDVSKYTLVCFGGAGGQHACRVADSLGMNQIFIPPFAGVLSAYGMGLANLRVLKEQTIALPLDESFFDQITEALASLTSLALSGLVAQGVPEEEVEISEHLHVRYDGSDSAIPIKASTFECALEKFETQHKKLFGFSQSGKGLVVETITSEASGGGAPLHKSDLTNAHSDESVPLERVAIWSNSAWQTVPVYESESLTPGQSINGPALLIDKNATTVIEKGWRADIDQSWRLILTRYTPRSATSALDTTANPVLVEIFNSLFMSIAEQMGAALQNTAHSVNIKERLDFSCAVFDASGALVANAPHMPVHLGSMGESVRAVIEAHGSTMESCDAFITNAPYNGGTHLPDVTVVAPVHDASTGERVFFVAARGHHADIGGMTPGSMPPNSRSIDDEGVLFDAAPLVRNGVLLEEEIRSTLASGLHPARTPDQNIADLRAQVAACTKGATELRAIISHYGLEGVKAYTDHVQDNAEESVRRVIDSLQEGHFIAPMDDGGEIHVAISIDRPARAATVDFSGTSNQRPTNYNAPAAVCRAAVLYVFRTLVNDDIPLNEGCLKPLTLVIPEGSMLNPTSPAAVVAGNVETSQVICDALYGAINRLAASQGTMNNLTFGNTDYQYYETLCGGTGAGPGFDGADAVHSHMTNSRLTDPEVLEWRYPVLLESFGVRKDSGGVGERCGGDGAVRRIRFLEPMSVAMLAGRRTTAPFGLEGGHDGQPGLTQVERANGDIQTLAYADATDVEPGDVVTIATPGGGGFGHRKPQ